MPQWNCACPNCRDARNGRVPVRTQSSVAIEAGPNCWFLVNASPDLGSQIEAFSPLQPSLTPVRNTPVAGVLLTNADLDHVLGLFLLREGPLVNVYATPAVREAVEQSVGLTKVLEPFCGITWHEPPVGQLEAFAVPNDASSPLRYGAIPLPATPPPFINNEKANAVHSVAYQFVNTQTNRRLVIAPDVAQVTDDLKQAMAESDAVLFDGTFWSVDELAQVRRGARSAREMGHVTMRDCSLDLLASLAGRHRVYIHINNTNPVLSPDSPERAAVDSAGIVVGYDGLEFEL